MLLSHRTENGLTILMEPLPDRAGVSMGFFFLTSGIRETPETLGWVHLIEHLIFRKTQDFSSIEIATLSDELGSEINGYTEKEEMALTMTIPSGALGQGLSLLMNLASRAEFSEDDLKREKKIILQEIKMNRDDTEDFLWEKSLQYFFPGEFGKPILGTMESLRKAEYLKVRSFYKDFIRNTPKVLILAGNFQPNFVLAFINKFPLTSAPYQPLLTPDFSRPIKKIIKKTSGQVHILILVPIRKTLSYEDTLYYSLLNYAFGEGNSSRLFQNIREKWGLSYQVYSSFHHVGAHGAISFYGATSPQRAKFLEKLLLKEWKAFCSDFSEQEWNIAFRAMNSQITLQVDRLESRVDRIFNSWHKFQTVMSIEDQVKTYETLSFSRCGRYLESLFVTPFSVFILEDGKG